MTWRKWWYLEIAAFVTLFFEMWGLSILRFAAILITTMAACVFYRHRIKGQDAYARRKEKSK